MLLFRSKRDDTRVMLFPPGRLLEVPIWMRNTSIPLYSLFIRADGIIHRIEAMTEPLSDRVIASQGPVYAVLELAGGAAARLGIKAGDKVNHKTFEAAKQAR